MDPSKSDSSSGSVQLLEPTEGEIESIPTDDLIENNIKKSINGETIIGVGLSLESITSMYKSLFYEKRYKAAHSLSINSDIAVLKLNSVQNKIFLTILIISYSICDRAYQKLFKHIDDITGAASNLNDKNIIIKKTTHDLKVFLKKEAEFYNIHELYMNAREIIQTCFFGSFNILSYPNVEQYLQKCIECCWSMVTFYPKLTLEFQSQTFDENYHTRFYKSVAKCNTISEYQWPTLCNFDGSVAYFKGIVIT